jgi:Family of unknown function (DUF5937)
LVVVGGCFVIFFDGDGAGGQECRGGEGAPGAMLHVLAEPGHHPQHTDWAGDVWAGLRPELAERLLWTIT